MCSAADERRQLHRQDTFRSGRFGTGGFCRQPHRGARGFPRIFPEAGGSIEPTEDDDGAASYAAGRRSFPLHANDVRLSILHQNLHVVRSEVVMCGRRQDPPHIFASRAGRLIPLGAAGDIDQRLNENSAFSVRQDDGKDFLPVAVQIDPFIEVKAADIILGDGSDDALNITGWVPDDSRNACAVDGKAVDGQKARGYESGFRTADSHLLFIHVGTVSKIVFPFHNQHLPYGINRITGNVC